MKKREGIKEQNSWLEKVSSITCTCLLYSFLFLIFSFFLSSLITHYMFDTIIIEYHEQLNARSKKAGMDSRKRPVNPGEITKDVTPPLLAPIATLVVPSFPFSPHTSLLTLLLLFSFYLVHSTPLLIFFPSITMRRDREKRGDGRMEEENNDEGRGYLDLEGNWAFNVGSWMVKVEEDESDLITIHSQHSSSSVSQKLPSSPFPSHSLPS